MRIARKYVAVMAALLTVALMGGMPSAATAAPGDPLNPQPNGSEGGLFVYNSSGTLIDDATYEFARSEPIYGSGSATHVMAPISGTAVATDGSTESYTFIASQANVRAGGINSWEAWAPGSQPSGGMIAPQLTASAQIHSNSEGLSSIFADIGGTYYLGIAYTRNNGVTVDSAVYRTMRILPGNRYTLDLLEIEPAASEQITPGEPVTSDALGALGEMQTMNEPLGTEKFELIMPAEVTSIALGVVQRGVTGSSPAALGQFAVIDTRANSLGWYLTISATDFASGVQAIEASALGYEPVSVGVLPDGVLLGSPKPAGSGSFGEVASGGAGSATPPDGAAFNLNFTFQPPGDAVPGTYTSTVTLTLMSP